MKIPEQLVSSCPSIQSVTLLQTFTDDMHCFSLLCSRWHRNLSPSHIASFFGVLQIFKLKSKHSEYPEHTHETGKQELVF